MTFLHADVGILLHIKKIFILIQVVTLTYVGCTLGPDKSVNHEHDSRCNIVRRGTVKCSKQFIRVAIILSQMT